MSKQASNQDDYLKPGKKICDRWVVRRKIGKGGFGQIYEALDLTTDEHVAIKAESNDLKLSLRFEAAILKQLKKLTPCKHVCKLIHYGTTERFAFMVMTLVGKNIAQLRAAKPNAKYSVPAAMHIGLQALEAIEALHSIGVLHRDVKPSNMAVGRDSATAQTVYLIDFGLARRYLVSGNLKPPRPVVDFRGTVRYASVNAHRRVETGRHDDLWSLLYVLVEAVVGKLPWTGEKDKEKVGRLKMDCDVTNLCRNLPIEFSLFFEHLRTLDYFIAPDYYYIRWLLVRCLECRRLPPAESCLASGTDCSSNRGAAGSTAKPHRDQLKDSPSRASSRPADDGYSSARLRECDFVDEPIRDASVTLRNSGLIVVSANARATLRRTPISVTNLGLESQVADVLEQRSDASAMTDDSENGSVDQPANTNANAIDANVALTDVNQQSLASYEKANEMEKSINIANQRCTLSTTVAGQHATAFANNKPPSKPVKSAQRVESVCAQSATAINSLSQSSCRTVLGKTRSASADGRTLSQGRSSSRAYDTTCFTFTLSLQKLCVGDSHRCCAQLVPEPPQQTASVGTANALSGATFRRRRYRPSALYSSRVVCT